ncbi:hypothetical protein [Psychrobacter sp. Marseille-P5312]|uniref:hypothetical protein n=1 Tax=Psychrobacter sp. Marseille-P5312 TaxID=2086574 RepID=UPI000CF6DF7A|nr:hypothetical protein [Psychrobacter sp. Marseille-P5312]
MNQQSQSVWQLDKSKAAKVGQSNYITGDTSDVYKIISAAWKTNTRMSPAVHNLTVHIMNADKSTTMIEIPYADESGRSWSGENIINAMMLCTNTPSLSQVQGSYQEYNYDEQKDVTVSGMVAPELAGKKVGMFLTDRYYFHKTKYEVKRGAPELFNVFDADTRQLPFEKANNQPANPDAFNTVTEAMIKYSAKSKEKAENEAAMNGQPQNGFNNQMNGGNPMQSSSVSYQRGAATQNQQGYQNQNNAPANNPAMNGGGPVDDDIPFAPYFDGQF